MSRVVVLAFLATASAVSLAPKTLAQPSTPGQINDPSTYRGSMANQAAEQAQFRPGRGATNQQMLQRMDQNYAGYAQGGRGGGGGPPPKPLKSFPLLAAAKNPLLGMWRMGEGQKIDLNQPCAERAGRRQSRHQPQAAGAARSPVLGKPGTVIRFTPTQLNWVAPDGHDEILNHVEYHANGNNVIVIPTDSDLVVDLRHAQPRQRRGRPLRLHAEPHQHRRQGGDGRPAGCWPGGWARPLRRAPRTGGVAVAAGQAILKLTVGEVIDGRLNSPPAGTRLFLTSCIRTRTWPAPGSPPWPAVRPSMRCSRPVTSAMAAFRSDAPQV